MRVHSSSTGTSVGLCLHGTQCRALTWNDPRWCKSGEGLPVRARVCKSLSPCVCVPVSVSVCVSPGPYVHVCRYSVWSYTSPWYWRWNFNTEPQTNMNITMTPKLTIVALRPLAVWNQRAEPEAEQNKPRPFYKRTSFFFSFNGSCQFFTVRAKFCMCALCSRSDMTRLCLKMMMMIIITVINYYYFY